ncbi:MAG TPA: hypothetical protein VMD25_06920 [Acidobacteriaceae bacterium]|nr:hypothetical protein [Acidobacteriaceae bacterium]
MKVLRSIASVIVSYFVVYLIVVLTDPILSRLYPGVYVPNKVPPTFLLWIGTGVFAFASVVGGVLCVRLAPTHPGLHLLVLFVLGEAAGTASAVAIWKTWPHWYSLAWLALWPVCLGIGALAGRRKSREKPLPVGAD